MKTINILYLIDSIHGMGGTEKHLSQLVTHLNKSRFRCSIITFIYGKDGKSFLDRITGHDILFIHLPIGRFYSPTSIPNVVRLWRFIREKEIDLVQTFHFTSDTFGVLISRLAGVSRIISSKRDTGALKGKHHLFLHRLVNPLISKHTAVADAVADRVSELEKIHRDSIKITYNGIELPELPFLCGTETLRKKYKISKEDFVVGSVAHMRPEKGYDVFLRAIRELRLEKKRIKALIVGRVFPRYTESVKKEGIEDDVIFAGHTDKVKEHISIMDVACLTAVRNEGLSNAILEEMALAKPVVATKIGGSPELVIHNKTGILIEPGDVEGLVMALSRLYEDRELGRRMGEEGRRRVEQDFGIDRMVQTMENLYTDMMYKSL